MIRVCISGVGRTGSEVAKILLEEKDIEIVAAICSPGSSKLGVDLGEIIGTDPIGVRFSSADEIESIVFKTMPDVVVDFSTPEAAIKNAGKLTKMQVNMVIGTTGLNEEQINGLYSLTHRYNSGIVYAPNITLGVNVLLLLTNIASNILNNYDFHITEIHHKHKKDSPSGTALKIAKEVEKGTLLSGNNTSPVSIDSIRAGGVVGVHKIMLVGEYDKLEISHESFSRKVFALGALKAIRFINNKIGYYEMGDVLQLDKVLGDYLDQREVM